LVGAYVHVGGKLGVLIESQLRNRFLHHTKLSRIQKTA